MELSSILTSEAIRSVSKLSSKKRLFQEIADLASSSYGLNAELAFAALQEREILGPTGVGGGVALPHARLADLDKVVATFVRLDKPLDFESADKQPVDLFFTLFAPMNAGVDHLKALALVSRTMRENDICKKLRANNDVLALHVILTEGPTSQAA